MDELFTRIMDKIPFPQSYHNFTDKREFYGIPNTMNVISNIAIMIPALYLLQKQKGVSLLSVHILLLAVTSSYYHFLPNDERIFWDMIFVISLNTVILSFFISKNAGILMYVFGIASVIYWKYNDDIRLYEFLKVVIPLYVISLLYKNNQMNSYVYVIICCMVLVRISEYNDKDIYELTHKKLSGHTLKHIIASVEIYYVILLLVKLGKIT